MQIYYLLIVTLLIIYMIINKIQYKLDFNKKMVFVLISCILLSHHLEVIVLEQTWMFIYKSLNLVKINP